MAPKEKLSNGSPCPRCKTGTLKVTGRTPIWRKPGKSEARLRCTGREEYIRQVRDDRFGD